VSARGKLRNITNLTEFNHVVFVCIRFGRLYWGHGSFGSTQQNCENTTIDVTTFLNQQIVSANATGASYQWLDCNVSKTPIVTATNQSFTITQTGSYAVEVSLAGCKDASECILISTVGISNIENDNRILNVFPNPNNGMFSLNIENVTGIKVHDINGSFVTNLPISSEQNLSHLNPSIYNLVVSRKKDVQVIKLILQ
tara:strand:- start:286 stop:879 length:594 start_codon:yes stop_codon:yes gene_type:complete